VPASAIAKRCTWQTRRPCCSSLRTVTGHGCNPSGTTSVSGNWWVDCSAELSIGNGTTVTFSGGNVVFDGGLSMTGGALNFNSPNPPRP